MPRAHESDFHPYRWHVFRTISLTLLLVTLFGNAVFYAVRTRQVFGETRDTLQRIAARVAQAIPVSLHESLQKPEHFESADYQKIEQYFQSVMHGNPAIADIYTLRPTAEPHAFTFVVSGQETEDKNGNNFIEENEEKAVLGEPYDTADFPELEEGLEKVSADKGITYDKWGAWVSGYAPLRDASGKAVAVVGVDYAAASITGQRRDLLRSIAIADAIVLPVVLLVAFALASRLSRPFRILAQGMERVAHGDLDHRLPLRHKGEEAFFVDFFHNMMAHFNAAQERKNKEGEEDRE